MEVPNPLIDNYLTEGCGRCPLGSTPGCKVHNWTEELKALRSIALACGLTEELKWGVPCYTYKGGNVLIVSAFKESATLSFFKGSLLEDTNSLLVKPGEHSQASRMIKFTDVARIIELEHVLKAYIFQAIEVERAGLRVEFKKNPEPIPDELQDRLDGDPVFKAAFESLTPGRQRGYIIHFSQPKQSKTRVSRIEKWTPMILNGEGMQDGYLKSRKA